MMIIFGAIGLGVSVMAAQCLTMYHDKRFKNDV